MKKSHRPLLILVPLSLLCAAAALVTLRAAEQGASPAVAPPSSSTASVPNTAAQPPNTAAQPPKTAAQPPNTTTQPAPDTTAPPAPTGKGVNPGDPTAAGERGATSAGTKVPDAARKTPASGASPATPKPKEPGHNGSDPTIAPDSQESADSNVSFPVDI